MIDMQSLRRISEKILPALLLAVSGLRARGEANGLIQPAPTAPSAWTRIVMVGASASAGFTFSEPFGGTNTLQCRLSPYLDAAVKVPHEPVKNLANALFFLQPEAAGQMEIEQALKLRPTLVVGVDFPFWFCYGEGTNDAERLQRFERGLKLLDSVLCPLVLGDIPDASSATNTGIITPAQVPSTAARSAANQRLKKWAATRPQVVIVPLSDFMRSAMADQALTVHGQTLSAGKTRAILQSDRLHPNPSGAAWLALGILDALVVRQPGFAAADVRWNAAEVLRLGSEAASARPKISTNASANPATSAK